MLHDQRDIGQKMPRYTNITSVAELQIHKLSPPSTLSTTNVCPWLSLFWPYDKTMTAVKSCDITYFQRKTNIKTPHDLGALCQRNWSKNEKCCPPPNHFVIQQPQNYNSTLLCFFVSLKKDSLSQMAWLKSKQII